MIKVMVINPPRVNGWPVVREERFEHKDVGSVYPPLNLLYVASVIEKEKIPLNFIDANGFDLGLEDVKKKVSEYEPNVIITRCAFDTQKEDLKFLDEIKKICNPITIIRNKIIGDVAELRDEILKNDCVDIFLNQEPEGIIVDLLNVIDNKGDLGDAKGISFKKDGKIVTTAPGRFIDNLDELPFPAYHLLPSIKPYHTGVLTDNFVAITTTRGCPFGCTFCAFGKSRYRVRSPQNVVEELEYLKKKFNVKNVLFFDDAISLKKGNIEKICELMLEKKLDMEWVTCTRANTITEDMLKIMKRAGCKEIAFGIETGSKKMMESINKGVTLDDIRNAAKLCKKVGILFYGLVIIGLPGETKETIDETVEFIKEVDPFYTQLCFAVPFPNTSIYKDYDEKGFLLTKDWSRYCPLNNEPVIRTKELTKEELIKLRKRAYRKLLLRPGYLLRKVSLTDWSWNIKGLGKFLHRVYLLITNKEIR